MKYLMEIVDLKSQKKGLGYILNINIRPCMIDRSS